MSVTPVMPKLGEDLANIVGPDHVCVESSQLIPFAIDGMRPTASVMPGTAEEISSILKLANARSLSVVACGGFTQQSLGAVPSSVDILLRTDRLNNVLHYDPGDLTIGVSAGARVADVQRTVSESNLLLPLDVTHASQATIGGTLATSSTGPLKHGYGGAREYCIGVTFVTGDGRIAKAGGRVVKNVAGYDLMKLLIGSHGTLGVITSANFKLFPAPRQTRTFFAQFSTLEDALALRRFVQRSPLSPMCLDIINPLAHSYLGSVDDSGWSIALRAGGSDAVLSRYRRELGDRVAKEWDGAEEDRFWGSVQDFSEKVAAQHHNALFLSVQTPPSTVEKALTSAQKIASDHNFLFACVGRVSLASLNFSLIPITVDPPSVMQYAYAISALRGALPRDSAVIVQRCPREAKEHISVWGSSTNDLEGMRAVKRALDPNDILNRGRFLF